MVRGRSHQQRRHRLVVESGVRQPGGGQYLTEESSSLLVLPDKAYLPHTRSVYHSGLMTRGYSSVWLWVQSHTAKAKPLRALTLLLSRDRPPCATGCNITEQLAPISKLIFSSFMRIYWPRRWIAMTACKVFDCNRPVDSQVAILNTTTVLKRINAHKSTYLCFTKYFTFR